MSGLFVPLMHDHMCGALTARSTVHALPIHGERGNRTVCGSDVPAISVADSKGNRFAIAWPPPKEDRCPDCSTALGTRGKLRGGDMWRGWLGADEDVS